MTADDVREPQPAPEGHLLALARLAARGAGDPRRTLVVDAGPTGIAAARAAGLRVVRLGATMQQSRDPHAASTGDLALPTLSALTPHVLAALLDPAPAIP